VTVPTELVESALAGAAGEQADVPPRIERRVRLAGGNISAVERLHTNHGTYILKSLPRDMPGLLRAEADGLEALRRSGTPLAVPAVIACIEGSTAFLILEDLGLGPAGDHFDERIGLGLAALHRCTAPRFGFPRDTFCGATSQPNTWTDSWTAFYGRQRLGHQMTLASRARLLSISDTSVIEQLISRLDTLLQEPEEGASLIHGDLWSGNLHVTAAGNPALIDPAPCTTHIVKPSSV
jgi:protein-ribulosamine 3-kinase